MNRHIYIIYFLEKNLNIDESDEYDGNSDDVNNI